MNETKLSLRQQKILEILQQNPDGLSRSALEDALAQAKIDVSKVTLLRDLNELLEANYVETQGVGKSVIYVYVAHPLLRYVDLDTYFAQDLDQREILRTFDDGVFTMFEGVFSEQELKHLSQLNQQYRKNVTSLPADIYKKELERFVIELSWKSSRIEGNTYSLLETEALIRDAKKAEGHSEDEAQMILNHKRALDIIIDHPQDFTHVTTKNVFDIHQALTAKMEVSSGIRKNRVGITGTNYRPLSNVWHLEESLKKLVATINDLPHPFEKAFLAVSGISYLQAFSDGNKRTARLLANAILMAHDWAPLSYRNVDEVAYKQAMLLFYEQNNLFQLKKIFIEQFEFVVEHYFQN